MRAEGFGGAADLAVVIDGALVVERPHLAGELVSGMDLRAPRWTLTPRLRMRRTGDGPWQVDADGFAADIGFARVHGLAAADATARSDGKPALGMTFDVDLQALGRLGGPVPAGLAQQPATLSGSLALAMPDDPERLADADVVLRDLLHCDARLSLATFAVGSNSMLRDVELAARMQGGKLALDLGPGASLAGGPLTLRATVDLAAADWATTLSLGLTGAQLGPDAVAALRCAVPLLAGLAGQPTVQFDSRAALTLELTGPARLAGAGWLDLLNHWAGQGNLQLLQGSVRPAAQVAGLLQWTGSDQRGLLHWDALRTDFRVRDGAVETALLKLDAKATELGITGRTRFDGQLEHAIDLKGLLRGHKDGDKVLAYLGDTKVQAALTGVLSAPELRMPDLQELVGKALTNAAEKGVRDAADQLLKKGLDELFKRRR